MRRMMEAKRDCPRCKGAGEVILVEGEAQFAVCTKYVCGQGYALVGQAVLRSRLIGPNYADRQKLSDLKAKLAEFRAEQQVKEREQDAKPAKLNAQALASGAATASAAAEVRRILESALKRLARSEAEAKARNDAIEKTPPKSVEAAEHAAKLAEALAARVSDWKRELELVFGRFPAVESKLVGRNA